MAINNRTRCATRHDSGCCRYSRHVTVTRTRFNFVPPLSQRPPSHRLMDRQYDQIGYATRRLQANETTLVPEPSHGRLLTLRCMLVSPARQAARVLIPRATKRPAPGPTASRRRPLPRGRACISSCVFSAVASRSRPRADLQECQRVERRARRDVPRAWRSTATRRSAANPLAVLDCLVPRGTYGQNSAEPNAVSLL